MIIRLLLLDYSSVISFASNGVLRSKDNGFPDEAFGNEGEIVREPGVDAAFERANLGDSFGSQQQRHTSTGRFVGSRAVENNVAIPGNLSVALFDLFHSYTKRARDHLRKRLDIHGLEILECPLFSARSSGIQRSFFQTRARAAPHCAIRICVDKV